MPHKADPAIYPKLRENALKIRLANLANNSVHAILMDWNVPNGTVTVLAAADGTASMYLSSGGGFLGGGQKYPAIREAALHAVNLAMQLSSLFQMAETIDLPPQGDIFFYLASNTGVLRAVATEAKLKIGTDPLASLGAAMQGIVTAYRLTQPAR